MSHARFSRYRLTFSDDGSVELTNRGATVWASLADPDFVDEFGEDVFGEAQSEETAESEETADAIEVDEDEVEEDEVDEDELIEDVFDYLVKRGYLTDAEADRCDVYMPKETTPNEP